MFGPQPLNFTLVAAVSTPQYRVVQGSGENFAGMATAANQKLIGISQNSAGVNEHITVCPIGLSRVYVNSAVAAYDRVTATASAGITVAGSGDVVVGTAMEAGVPGDIISVFVQ